MHELSMSIAMTRVMPEAGQKCGAWCSLAETVPHHRKAILPNRVRLESASWIRIQMVRSAYRVSFQKVAAPM